MIGQNIAADASLIIDDVSYQLDDSGTDPAVQVQTVATQPGDGNVEFERRLSNLGIGWGQSKYTDAGGYDYGDTAVLHRQLSWLGGAKVTDRTSDTTPTGAVSFCEYWDGVAANRRLVIVSAQHVFEIEPDGTENVADLSGTFTAARGMSKGVSFRTGTMTAPKVFIARPSATTTDAMVSRTGDGTYAVSDNGKYASALSKGKDSAGADVFWRINEDGKMNQSVADSDPDDSDSWSGASYPNSLYPLGSTASRVNDLVQQNRSMIAGKEDGAWTFDNVLNTIPVTPGMEQTPATRNFKWFKDANGMAVAPTGQGIIWIDGLEWGACGPVSSNPAGGSLSGEEVAVSSMVGNYIYGALWDGTDSWIFMGKPRMQADTGSGPFSWHGPVAKIAEQVTDLAVSTVFGKKLWIGYDAGWATIDLKDDFSPETDAASGKIYLPEGSLDMDGPGVIKDFRKAEFIAPAANPFSTTNEWTVELDMGGGDGYVAVDGGSVDSGVYAERYWSTETSGQRPRVRLSYSGGAAECEQVIVRGTERPETTDEYAFKVLVEERPKTPRGVRMPRAALTDLLALRDAVDAGRKTVVVYGETSFTGRVTAISALGKRENLKKATWQATITVRKVKTSA